MKKSLAVLLSAVLVLSVLSACTKKRESATGDVPRKVIVGTQKGPVPEAIVTTDGWLPEALGTEVDIVYFDAGRDINTAMASKSIDFGLLGSPPAAIGIANGLPYQVFYIQDVIGEAESLVVRSSLGIKDAKGLVGRRIATTFSSTSHYALMKYLEISNVNPSDIDIIDMRSSEITAAFLRGNIDGAFTWEPNTTTLKNNGGVILVSAREMADHGYPIMNLSIVRTEFAERYPDVVSAYVRAMDRAVALYRSDPKTAGAVMARQTGMSAEECLAQVASSVWLTVNEQKGMRWAGTSALANAMYSTAKFFYEQGDISQEPKVSTFQQAVTSRYLDSYTGK
jgi:taurine transport system substrate-binding protein